MQPSSQLPAADTQPMSKKALRKARKKANKANKELQQTSGTVASEQSQQNVSTQNTTDDSHLQVSQSKTPAPIRTLRQRAGRPPSTPGILPLAASQPPSDDDASTSHILSQIAEPETSAASLYDSQNDDSGFKTAPETSQQTSLKVNTHALDGGPGLSSQSSFLYKPNAVDELSIDDLVGPDSDADASKMHDGQNVSVIETTPSGLVPYTDGKPRANLEKKLELVLVGDMPSPIQPVARDVVIPASPAAAPATPAKTEIKKEEKPISTLSPIKPVVSNEVKLEPKTPVAEKSVIQADVPVSPAAAPATPAKTEVKKEEKPISIPSAKEANELKSKAKTPLADKSVIHVNIPVSQAAALTPSEDLQRAKDKVEELAPTPAAPLVDMSVVNNSLVYPPRSLSNSSSGFSDYGSRSPSLERDYEVDDMDDLVREENDPKKTAVSSTAAPSAPAVSVAAIPVSAPIQKLSLLVRPEEIKTIAEAIGDKLNEGGSGIAVLLSTAAASHAVTTQLDAHGLAEIYNAEGLDNGQVRLTFAAQTDKNVRSLLLLILDFNAEDILSVSANNSVTQTFDGNRLALVHDTRYIVEAFLRKYHPEFIHDKQNVETCARMLDLLAEKSTFSRGRYAEQPDGRLRQLFLRCLERILQTNLILPETNLDMREFGESVRRAISQLKRDPLVPRHLQSAKGSPEELWKNSEWREHIVAQMLANFVADNKWPEVDKGLPKIAITDLLETDSCKIKFHDLARQGMLKICQDEIVIAPGDWHGWLLAMAGKSTFAQVMQDLPIVAESINLQVACGKLFDFSGEGLVDKIKYLRLFFFVEYAANKFDYTDVCNEFEDFDKWVSEHYAELKDGYSTSNWSALMDPQCQQMWEKSSTVADFKDWLLKQGKERLQTVYSLPSFVISGSKNEKAWSQSIDACRYLLLEYLRSKNFAPLAFADDMMQQRLQIARDDRVKLVEKEQAKLKLSLLFLMRLILFTCEKYFPETYRVNILHARPMAITHVINIVNTVIGNEKEMSLAEMKHNYDKIRDFIVSELQHPKEIAYAEDFFGCRAILGMARLLPTGGINSQSYSECYNDFCNTAFTGIDYSLRRAEEKDLDECMLIGSCDNQNFYKNLIGYFHIYYHAKPTAPRSNSLSPTVKPEIVEQPKSDEQEKLLAWFLLRLIGFAFAHSGLKNSKMREIPSLIHELNFRYNRTATLSEIGSVYVKIHSIFVAKIMKVNQGEGCSSTDLAAIKDMLILTEIWLQQQGKTPSESLQLFYRDLLAYENKDAWRNFHEFVDSSLSTTIEQSLFNKFIAAARIWDQEMQEKLQARFLLRLIGYACTKDGLKVPEMQDVASLVSDLEKRFAAGVSRADIAAVYAKIHELINAKFIALQHNANSNPAISSAISDILILTKIWQEHAKKPSASMQSFYSDLQTCYDRTAARDLSCDVAENLSNATVTPNLFEEFIVAARTWDKYKTNEHTQSRILSARGFMPAPTQANSVAASPAALAPSFRGSAHPQ